MQNESEYPMRQRSSFASAAAFIHKLCLSEVDLIESMAWLCNWTRAIHKWDAGSSGFWFTGTHISLFFFFFLSAYVCERERESDRKSVAVLQRTIVVLPECTYFNDFICYNNCHCCRCRYNSWFWLFLYFLVQCYITLWFDSFFIRVWKWLYNRFICDQLSCSIKLHKIVKHTLYNSKGSSHVLFFWTTVQNPKIFSSLWYEIEERSSKLSQAGAR